MKSIGKKILKGLSFIGVFLLTLLVTVYLMGLLICYGPSENARNLFVTTFLETGQMKFVVKLFMTNKGIQDVVDSNKLEDFNETQDSSLIKVEGNNNDIELVKIAGNNFMGKMIIVKDPSRISLATTYTGSWAEYGVTLDTLVNDNNAFAGINGGLYLSSGNKGGRPMGFVVSKGEIQYNNPGGLAGLHLIGFDENNILKIIDLSGKNATQVAEVIKNEKIRDAVAFQEESSDANNHFVKLIINGEAREVKGIGSGANPRTAIGQRADGTVLLLVTDGRGANGHLGATAGDLISLMQEYGAVNAANIDGGSSSAMYYDGKYEMTSVTLYYSNSSWRLPAGFIIEKR